MTDRLGDEPLRSPREDEQFPPDVPAPLEPNGGGPLESPRDLEELPPETVDLDLPRDETDEPLDSFRD